jgi:hypothetical protein
MDKFLFRRSQVTRQLPLGQLLSPGIQSQALQFLGDLHTLVQGRSVMCQAGGLRVTGSSLDDGQLLDDVPEGLGDQKR